MGTDEDAKTPQTGTQSSQYLSLSRSMHHTNLPRNVLTVALNSKTHQTRQAENDLAQSASPRRDWLRV